MNKFLLSIDEGKKRSPEDALTIQRGMRAEFERMIDEFREGGILAFKGNRAMVFLAASDLLNGTRTAVPQRSGYSPTSWVTISPDTCPIDGTRASKQHSRDSSKRRLR